MLEKKFQIEQARSPNGNVLYLLGELDLSTASQFRAAIEPLAQESELMLELNLKQLNYIDSTGMGVIVSVLKTRDQLGAAMTIQEIPPKIKRLFDLTGITKFLEVTKH